LNEEGEITIVQSFGKGGIVLNHQVENPWLGIAQQSEKSLIAILDRLGLTPVNRKAVKSKPQEMKKEPDELELLMTRTSPQAWIAPPVSDDKISDDLTSFEA
jgi:hypothetical protein